MRPQAGRLPAVSTSYARPEFVGTQLDLANRSVVLATLARSDTLQKEDLALRTRAPDSETNPAVELLTSAYAAALAS